MTAIQPRKGIAFSTFFMNTMRKISIKIIKLDKKHQKCFW